jgi:hypothetical protein
MTRQRLTFQAAAEMLVAAKADESVFSIGTNQRRTEIILPAGEIDADKDGFFKRSDVCRLIGFAQMEARQ